MSNPRLFIGSSREAIPYVNAVFNQLERVAEITPWMDAFKPLQYTMDDLERQVDTNDFAVFICSPDDVINIRGDIYLITRDNTLFEMGLFWGKLKRGRVFYIIPNNSRGIVYDKEKDPADYHLMSDLTGLNPLTYTVRSDNNRDLEVKKACIAIEKIIIDEGHFPDPLSKIDELNELQDESEVVAKFSTQLSKELLRTNRSGLPLFLRDNLQRAYSLPEGYEIEDVGIWKVERTDGLKHVAGKKDKEDFYPFNINGRNKSDRILFVDSYNTSSIDFIKKSEFYNTYLICYPIENSMVITFTVSSEKYNASELSEDEKDLVLAKNKRLMKTINELFGGVSL